ncbi:hypothetical protein EGH22_08460 [Halomicroarcula sp. F28]|uniref:hypothetical protein n=1 Tax=Haloarcula salinisoli TaxID=2487746 RepID=UPI001C72D8B3|nr:hypothetical protein [Halomicroarcula salinisoli]MBX0286356.1 hypothetical protein [Halomicroarcula salinisoli]
MGAVPGGLDTDIDLPMAVPLRHFVVGLGFLVAGTLVGVSAVANAVPGLASLAHVHLLLVGWVCVTIMGAMTQFVPVWSGTSLYSQRLATVQLALVAAGVSGFVVALTLDAVAWLAPFGALMLAGFWTFAYNILRTLAALDEYDVTERHFGYALGFFCLLSLFGLVLAVDFTAPVTPSLPVEHGNLRHAHATIAVFGAVLTTVYGALYQLGTMFTQTELHGVDQYLQSLEAVAHPLGVVLLAGGRLVDSVLVAQLGGLLVVAAAFAMSTVLGRRLYEMRVEWEPMHTRYAVVAVALAAWAVSTAPAWLGAPTTERHLFGASGSAHLLALGVIGLVLVGTLYHIVPFIIWVDRYSDRLGFEAVPMIDDLYDDRLAAIDGTLWVGGTVVIVGAELADLSPGILGAGGLIVTLSVAAFAANMLLVVHEHGPDPFDRVLLGSLSPRPEPGPDDDGSTSEV